MQLKYILISSPGFIIPSIINLFCLLTISRIISLKDFGEYSLYLLAIELIHGIGYGWIKSSMTRFFSVFKEEVLKSISIKLVSCISILIAFIGSGIYLYCRSSFLVLTIIFLIIFRGLLFFILDWYRISEDNLKRYSIFAIAISVFYSLPPVLFLFYDLKATFQELLLVQLISVTILILYKLRLKYFILLKTAISISNLKQFIYFGLPILISFLAMSSFVRIDRFLIDRLFDMEIVGIYSLGFSTAQFIISSFFMLITIPTFPKIIKYLNSGNPLAAKAVFQYNWKIIITVGCVILPIVFFFKNEILFILLGEENRSSVSAFWFWIVFALYIYNIKLHHFDQLFIFSKQTMKSMLISLFGGILHLIAGFFLLKYFGLNGISYSSIIISLFSIFIILFLNRKSLFLFNSSQPLTASVECT